MPFQPSTLVPQKEKAPVRRKQIKKRDLADSPKGKIQLHFENLTFISLKWLSQNIILSAGQGKQAAKKAEENEYKEEEEEEEATSSGSQFFELPGPRPRLPSLTEVNCLKPMV